jgi:ABC-type nickel/cobalt efflux system permease component RcnA
MIWRSRIWTAVAAIFTVVNVAGAVMAAMQGEAIHTGVHVLLALIGAYFIWRLALRRSEDDVAPELEHHPSAAPPPTSPQLADRLTHLEQAVDAVAIEVERIGEGQRFITRSFVDKDHAPARAGSSAEPTDTEVKGTGSKEHRG